MVGAEEEEGAGTGNQPRSADSCCSATRDTQKQQHVGNAAASSWRGCSLTHLPHRHSPAGTAGMSWHSTAHPAGRLDQTVLEAWHHLQVHTASSKTQALKPHCCYCFVSKGFNPSGYKEYFQSMECVYSPASLGRAQTTLPRGEESMEEADKGPGSQSLYGGSKKAAKTILQRSEHPATSKSASNTKQCGAVKTLQGKHGESRGIWTGSRSLCVSV